MEWDVRCSLRQRSPRECCAQNRRMPIMNELERALGRPVASAQCAQFRAAGISRGRLLAAYRRGELERIRIGWYCRPGLATPVREAIRVGGSLACISAAAEHGIEVPGDHRLHLRVPGNASRLRDRNGRPAGRSSLDREQVVLHWDDRHSMPADAYLEDPLDALLRAAGCATGEWWVAMIESAMRSRVGSGPILRREQLVELHRRAMPELRGLLARVEPGAESCLETLFRLRMRAAGVPVRAQVPLPGGYRADFMLGEELVIEIDGRRHHGTAEGFERDRARDAVTLAFGRRVLRLSARQILQEWESTAAAVLLAYRRAPSRSRGRLSVP